MFHRACLILVLTVTYKQGVDGFSSGPPTSACASMIPAGHQVSPQSAEPPYELVVDKSWYAPGETITGQFQVISI